jgi:hypothetical protein
MNVNPSKATSSLQVSGTRSVQLSTLSSILNALQTESPERTARLNLLSTAVATRSYGIDPFTVGASVISESLSAGGAARN